MSIRVSRDVMPGATAVLFGWMALAVGVGAGAVASVEGPSLLIFSVALLLSGGIWIAHGKHLRRRPRRYVQVDADGVLLMPEGQRFAAGGLGPLTIMMRRSVSGNLTFIATVYSVTAQIALAEHFERSEPEARAAAEAWIAKIEAAHSGRLAADEVADLDVRLEAPAPEFLIGAAAVTLEAWGLTGVAYGTTSGEIMFGVGVGTMGVAAVSSWRLLGRRRWARIAGLIVGVALILRPIVLPLMVSSEAGGTEALGLLAERHLGFFFGGGIALLAGWLGGLRSLE